MKPAKYLNGLLEHPCPRTGEELQVVAGGIEVRVRLRDWDRLGCLFERLSLEGAPGRTLALDPERVEERVTYLGEPLEVIEKDEGHGVAVLRSRPPRKEKSGVSFFEMTVDRQRGAELVRYAYDHHSRERNRVAAPLTRETLERLVSDLVELAQ
ncbi:MAG: hypothetical protein AB1896_02030 [Thermodesulfobacteriota bacterium]